MSLCEWCALLVMMGYFGVGGDVYIFVSGMQMPDDVVTGTKDAGHLVVRRWVLPGNAEWLHESRQYPCKCVTMQRGQSGVRVQLCRVGFTPVGSGQKEYCAADTLNGP